MATNAALEGYVPDYTVGWRIRMAREYAGLDQRQLAARTGIARNTISNYEQGLTHRTKKLYLRQIALACGVDPHWLVTGEDRSGGVGVTPSLVRARSRSAHFAHRAAS